MFKAKRTTLLRSARLLCCLAALSCAAEAQRSMPAEASSSAVESLPDAPQSATPQADADRAKADKVAVQDHQDLQTKRILGIIPNFRSVSADLKLPPQPVKEKFITATQDTFDYSAVLLPAVLAGYAQAKNSTPEFHQGAAGYGRYFWHTYVDQATENYMVEFIGPTIFRQDSRYYTLGKGGFVKRATYSLSRVAITRNDAGKEVFNASEIFGAGAGAGISNLYYPSKERSFGNTAGKWGQSVGIDAATFLFKEFWPDINHHLFHGKAGGQ